MNENESILHQENASGAAVAAALALEIGKPRIWAPTSAREVAYVLVPNEKGGCDMGRLEAPLAPPRPTGIYKVDTLTSFTDIIGSHKVAGRTACYARQHEAGANLRLFAMTCVFNEHERDSGPGFRDHRAVFDPPTSVEYRTWMGKNGHKFKGNEDLAEFLEDNVVDVIEPPGATMLEMALNFHVRGEVQFGNPVSLANGAQKLSITKVVQGNAKPDGSVVIPDKFAIRIPVLRGDPTLYRFDARFRYRLGDGGALTLWYDFIRPETVLDRVFEAAVKAVNPVVPVYLGAADFDVR